MVGQHLFYRGDPSRSGIRFFGNGVARRLTGKFTLASFES